MSRAKPASLYPFLRQLAVSISAGIPVVKSISLLANQTRDLHLQQVLRDVGNKLEQGSTFSSALEVYADFFPPVVIETVRLGEITGRLDITLADVAEQLEQDYRFRNKIKSALIYPCLQLFVLLAVICLVTILFAGVKTLITGLSIIIGLLLAGYIGLRYMQKEPSRRRTLQKIKTAVPIIGGIIKQIAWARFCRVLAMMINSALPVDRAINQAARSAHNPLISEQMLRVEPLVRQGQGLAESMAAATSLPPLIKEMILVGEKAGKIDETLNKVAQWYEDSVARTLTVLPILIGPVMLVIMGIAVAYLIYRVYIVEYLGTVLSIGRM